MDFLAAVAAAATVFLLVLYFLRSRMARPSETRLRVLSAARNVTIEHQEDGEALLRRGPSSIPAISRFLSTRGYASKWAVDLERADLKLRTGEYFLMRALLALAVGGLIMLIGRNPAAVLIGIVAAAIAYMLPATFLKLRIQRRLRAIEGQLVETVTLVANGLRAGFGFAQSIESAGNRMGPPISNELNRMLLDINLGATTEDALRAMNDRIGSDDIDMVVTAILIQRTTGGNLAEILEQVTETMRERERIHGEIRTLTSSQRLTAWVLSLWPAVLGLVFFAINPSMMSLLWTTGAGFVLLGLWFVLNLLGVVSLQKILAIDV